MRNKAFTLIELLVVIAIIGLISSIVLVNVKGARDKARIAKTQTDLDAFRQALNLYEGDNGKFPDNGGCENEGPVSGCLLGVLNTYSNNLPSTDPWGNDYLWHNPHCCDTECVMILSKGPDKIFCSGADYNCEHYMGQTSNCLKPNISYDDIGIYFGQVKDH